MKLCHSKDWSSLKRKKCWDPSEMLPANIALPEWGDCWIMVGGWKRPAEQLRMVAWLLLWGRWGSGAWMVLRKCSLEAGNESVSAKWTKWKVQYCVAAGRITQLAFSTAGDQKVEAQQFVPLMVCFLKILALSWEIAKGRGGVGGRHTKKGYLRTVEGKEANKSLESELDMEGKRETLI